MRLKTKKKLNKISLLNSIMVESNSVPSISYPRLGDWEVRSTIGRGNVK